MISLDYLNQHIFYWFIYLKTSNNKANPIFTTNKEAKEVIIWLEDVSFFLYSAIQADVAIPDLLSKKASQTAQNVLSHVPAKLFGASLKYPPLFLSL